jgi:hypothetical protein
VNLLLFYNGCIVTITPELVAALGTAFGGFLAAFYAFNKWIITKFLSELKPNGGGSMRDKVDINTDRLTRVEQRVDDIYTILAKEHHG